MWCLEHHFSDYSPTPSPLVLLSHVAARRPELNLGTSVLVLPWYHPVRLAGEIGMLALLSSGQLYLGLGRGTAKFEYDRFGLDMGDARERFAEIYDVLRLALSGEPFTYDGNQVKIDKETCVRPNVAHLLGDRVHLLGAIGSPSSGAAVGTMGMAPLSQTIGDIELTAQIMQNWEAATREAGGDTDVIKPIVMNCIIEDTDKEGVAQAQTHITRFMEAQVQHYTPDEVDWENLPSYKGWKERFEGMKRLTDPANMEQWASYQLVGSPETVRRRLDEYLEIGFNHVAIQTATPGVPLELRRRWSRRFAEEVAAPYGLSTMVSHS
jgi:alkanesulfonate monooxygenase SsuD/methylene tetrahydromethanopterin reductase-like flavin-dependent oxidoreductase (luciferase family)